MAVSLRWKCRIIALLLLALGGCSMVRVSYDQGPTLAYWWLDAQLDFDPAQRAPVQAGIDRWFAWHRATQLPELADWLAEQQRRAAGKVTPAQVCATWDNMQQRLRRWYERALPELVGPAKALGPAQLDHLEKKYAKDLERLKEDFVQPDPAERRKVQLERTVDRFETVYGPLSAAQKRQIAAALADSPFDAARWVDERRQRQRDIVATLRRIATERPDDAAAIALLRGLGEQAAVSPRPAYRAMLERTMQANCGFIAAMHNAMTDEQRRHALERLKDWEEDARALARGSATEPQPRPIRTTVGTSGGAQTSSSSNALSPCGSATPVGCSASNGNSDRSSRCDGVACAIARSMLSLRPG